MMIDRLSIRTRPPGWPVMYQTWDKLLFLHWPVAAELLRPLIAPRLSLDTFEGRAWVGITSFTMWGIRPAFLPPLPVLSTSHELNVRTYVHLDGVPGVWFFSLDASNALAVWGARVAYGLPYFRARMQLQEHHAAVHFTSTRTHPGAPAAQFEATWTGGDPLPPAAPGSLDFFLTERYCLYTARGGQLYRAHLSRPLATPPSRAAVLHVDDAGIPGLADATGGPAAARAGRASSGGHLASREGLTSAPSMGPSRCHGPDTRPPTSPASGEQMTNPRHARSIF